MLYSLVKATQQMWRLSYANLTIKIILLLVKVKVLMQVLLQISHISIFAADCIVPAHKNFLSLLKEKHLLF
jgi:hypothetical protein